MALRELSMFYQALSEWDAETIGRNMLDVLTNSKWEGTQIYFMHKHLERARLWLERFEAIHKRVPYVGWRILHFYHATEHRAIETSFQFESVHGQYGGFAVIRDHQTGACWKVEIGGTRGFTLVLPQRRAFAFGCPVAVEWFTLVPKSKSVADSNLGQINLVEMVRKYAEELFCDV